jgi:hypothetical protein
MHVDKIMVLGSGTTQIAAVAGFAVIIQDIKD